MQSTRTTRRLTCGFVFRFDTSGMLSRSPETIDARGQASSHWPRLLLFSGIVFCLSLLSLDTSYAWKNHSMNLKLYAHNQIKDWSEFECYVELIHRESSWRYWVRNGSHTGLGQMRSEWYGKLPPRKQIRVHLKYLDHRYQGSACKALRHMEKVGWH